jgi:TonB-linked SusC/RagA family outer membrane protein
MKKILLISFMLVSALISESWAQDRTITGKVTSDEDGSGLPGVNVILKGTTTGTTTDIDGNYKVNVPEAGGTLVFSFIGLATKEVAIGSRSTIDVGLSADFKQLSEVVVTAIGIEREKKALGYAVSTVSDELIANRPEGDVSRVLQGKVAGVNITATNGMSGSGTNIIIRGYSSATGSNQPLFIVDGVPFNTATNTNTNFQEGGAVSSSRFLDIDPNNIQEVNVLKGLSATVLYGDQGRNGVILITTKSGSAKKRPAEVTLNQSYFANQAASLPTYGQIYGNGFQQQPGFFFSNYGPRMDQGLTIGHPYATTGVAAIRNAFPEFRNPDGTPVPYEYKAYADPSEVFFRTGGVHNTSLQISGSTDKTGFNASFGYTDEQGFLPGNTLEKYNFGLGVSSAITDKLSINSSFTFAITKNERPPVNAAFGSGPAGGIPSAFAHVLYTPRSVDLGGLPHTNPIDNSSVYFRGNNDIVNPLWLVNNYQDESNVSRFFNSTSLVYDITENLNVTYRFGLDTYSESQQQRLNKGGPSSNINVTTGLFRDVNITNTIWNQDLVFSYTKELSEKVGITALLGGNSRYDRFERTGLTSIGQLAFGLFNHSNFENTSARDPYSNGILNFLEEERRMGIYSQITLDYDDFLFFNVTARNDWTSTVEPDNRRILYPGASVSFIPTSAFDISSATLNELKVRLGYGTSAGFPPPYRTRNILNQNARAFQNVAGTLFPTHQVNTQLGNPNLSPELHTEVELGLEGIMFNNKLKFDISLYQKNTSDLITQAPIDPATGFTSTFINIGNIRNRGIEAQLSFTPISTPSGFNWESTVNFGLYRPVVTELGEGLEQVVVAGYTNLGNFAEVGKPFNMIKGIGIRRTEDGQPIVLPSGDYAQTSEIVDYGDPNPRWNGSWINTLTYKNFNFNFMLEYRHRGMIYSNTVTATLARGVTKDPVADREFTFILPGVKEVEPGVFVPNDIQVTASNYFFNGFHTGAEEANVFDGSTIRLREVSIGYNLPANIIESTPFKRASVALSATNLWFRALNFPPNMNFDTDVLGLGVGNGLGFDFVTGPSSRRFGGTLTLVF